MASRSATETAPEHMVSQDLLTHAVNASMIDYIDKKVVVTMRDDCQIVGRIRTFDQFNNIVLTDASQRYFYNGTYADKSVGSVMIRGESLAYVGVLNERNYSFREVTKDALFQAREAAGLPPLTKSTKFDAFNGGH